MINAVSNASAVSIQESQATKPQKQAPVQRAQPQEDSVQLSAHAKAAAASSQDTDHDGDSR